ncbi:GNAT family N-acetyltransferase [Curtobacterium herbarum]|uniref:GNAT family N-acetyltransferase n=1 Tax=Curtobacterium herbarum TaxID=150122 RepID=UPI0035A90577
MGRRKRDTYEPELAFELLQQFWGQGFATEASRMIVGRAVVVGYDHLAATIREWNGIAQRARRPRVRLHRRAGTGRCARRFAPAPLAASMTESVVRETIHDREAS